MLFRKGKSQSDNLGEIYDLYFTPIYKFFYYKVLSKEIAEDLCSETFLAFAEKLNYEGKIENERSYLYGIARNVFTKFLQRKYKETALDFTDKQYLLKDEKFFDYTKTFVKEIESKPRLEDRIKPFVDKLPEKQRRVIKMRLLEKMKLKEICKKLGKNMNYVKTTQKRGLKSLKKLILMDNG